MVRALLQAFHGGPVYIQEQVLTTMCEWWNSESGMCKLNTSQRLSQRKLDMLSSPSTVRQRWHRGQDLHVSGIVVETFIPLLAMQADETSRKLIGQSMQCVTLIG